VALVQTLGYLTLRNSRKQRKSKELQHEFADLYRTDLWSAALLTLANQRIASLE
jgi:hypothetical protein